MRTSKEGPSSCSLPPTLRELKEARGSALETMTAILGWEGQSHRYRVRCEPKRWRWSCWGMEQMSEADNRRHMTEDRPFLTTHICSASGPTSWTEHLPPLCVILPIPQEDSSRIAQNAEANPPCLLLTPREIHSCQKNEKPLLETGCYQSQTCQNKFSKMT